MTGSTHVDEQQRPVALVTGSTGGIGLAIADALQRSGYQVVLHGVGAADALEVLRSDFAARHQAHTRLLTTDLAVPEDIERMMHALHEELGSIDVLVNNAGIQHVSPLESFPTAQWDKVLAINLSACFHTTRCALPGMRAKNRGRIINIASAHGLVGSPQKSAYVAAKHGLVGLTRVTALETARTGITANAICPGWVETPLVSQQIDQRSQSSGRSRDEERYDLVAEKHPSAEFVSPKQIASCVLWLASDGAAEVRGATLSIDGGWTAC